MLTVVNRTEVEVDSELTDQSYFYDLLHFEFFGIYFESIYGYMVFVSEVNNKKKQCTKSKHHHSEHSSSSESSQHHNYHLFILFLCVYVHFLIHQVGVILNIYFADTGWLPVILQFGWSMGGFLMILSFKVQTVLTMPVVGRTCCGHRLGGFY